MMKEKATGCLTLKKECVKTSELIVPEASCQQWQPLCTPSKHRPFWPSVQPQPWPWPQLQRPQLLL